LWVIVYQTTINSLGKFKIPKACMIFKMLSNDLMIIGGRKQIYFWSMKRRKLLNPLKSLDTKSKLEGNPLTSRHQLPRQLYHELPVLTPEEDPGDGVRRHYSQVLGLPSAHSHSQTHQDHHPLQHQRKQESDRRLPVLVPVRLVTRRKP
jgi:hypothetical protein